MTCEARFEVTEVQSSVNDLLREKYSRQILFAGLGEQGQERLIASSAVVVGCGAIGAAAANLLVRAGVGRIRIIDRDFVEPSNLQRQTLFDEADARDALPKAVAAERKLRSLNSSVSVEGIVADVNPRNARELLAGFDVILDGTDNFETRFLVNEFAVKSGQTWIYAAAVASYGLTMTIRPGLTPCLACLLPADRRGQGLEETCDTIGVLGSIVNLIASLEATEAIKLLAGRDCRLARAPRLLRCVDRPFPVRSCCAQSRMSGVRRPRICLPRWHRSTAYHHVRPRFRTDSRAWTRPRPCHTENEAGCNG